VFAAAATAIMVAIALALVRAFRGPSLFDRILAVNMIGTHTVLMVAVLGFLKGRPEYLDIALVYVLISFASTIAVLRVCTQCRFGARETGAKTKKKC
jgi:multicomponent Na+:H+ antiporter subunit F